MNRPAASGSGSPGDDGTTSLPGGRRVSKADDRIQALGALDELNAALGLLRASYARTARAGRIEAVQREVLTLGGDLAAGGAHLGPESTARLESEIQELEARLPPARNFDLPGTSEASARAHWARTVCRRAERDLIRAAEAHPDLVPPAARAYLNRLSGWLFALARATDAGL